MAEVRKAVDGEDVEAMKVATEALGEAIQKIGASVYESQEVGNAASETEAPQDGEAGPSSEESGEDDVIDGEVKE